MYVSFKLLEMFQCTYYEIVYLSSALAYEVNIKQLCSSAICIQNVSLSSRLSDSVRFNPTWSTLTLSTASSLTWSTCYFTTYPIWSTLSLPYNTVYGFMDFRLWFRDNLFCYAYLASV